MAAKQASDDVLSDINVTPLVDVMLVLLVVMMVTASTIVTQSLAVDLPEGKTGTASERQIIVTVTKQGALLLDDRPIDAASLRREVEQLKAQNTEVQALIAADGSARHAQVVKVLDLLREARVTRVAVGVTPL